MTAVKIGICGAYGRMGRSIVSAINHKINRFELVSRLGRNHSTCELQNFCEISDVIVDFSNPNVLENLTKEAANSNTRLIVGTTGLKQRHFEYLTTLSKNVAVIYATNTSLGANLVAFLSAKSAKLLKNYDIEITEAHHKYKKDAPSGTALMIGQAIANAINVRFKDCAVFDRANRGIRKKGDIGFSSIRGGGILGENEVIFAADHELFTIGSRALSRDAFADGALVAVAWIYNKKPGLYSMQDVLRL